MVGGGNSAINEALHLHNLGVEVTILHRRDSFRAQDHLVHTLAQSGIRALFNTEVEEIQGRDKVESVTIKNNQTGERQTLAIDGVFVAIGYEPATALAQKIGAEITDEGHIKRDHRHRTTVRGVYSAGDVEGGYKQIVAAVGQGAEAALAIFEDLINPYWKEKA